MPNLGIKSATAHNCERGIISLKGTPPAQTNHLSTHIEAAGSGNNPVVNLCKVDMHWLIWKVQPHLCYEMILIVNIHQTRLEFSETQY